MKATAAEVDSRVAKVAEFLVEGRNRAYICEHARNNWGISDGQADRYISKAREAIRENRKGNLDDILAIANARYEMLFARAVEKVDLRAAMSIVKEQTALSQLPSAKADVQDFEGFMTCLYAYSEALRAVLPPEYLRKVVEATRGIAPVAESLRESDPYDDLLRLAVEDRKALGRTRTREELANAGVFDSLQLPDAG